MIIVGISYICKWYFTDDGDFNPASLWKLILLIVKAYLCLAQGQKYETSIENRTHERCSVRLARWSLDLGKFW